MTERRAPGPAAAFFDVDGTLVRATVLHYYGWLLRRAPSPRGRAGVWAAQAALLARIPGYWWLDLRGRDRFLRVFYRAYAGWPVERLEAFQAGLFEEVVRPRLLPEGEATARAHRAAGRRLVLVTASLRWIVEPLARHLGADALICQELETREGIATGALVGEPLDGETRSARLQEYARGHGIDLAASYAYGDSAGDLPMLAAVGHPAAVNPCRALRREAARRGWPVLRWRPCG